MFGTLTYTDNGMVFEYWKTFDEAMIHGEVEKEKGHKVTIFNYDNDSKQFLEFYDV